MSSSFGQLPLCQSIPYHLATPTLQAEAVSVVRNVFQQDFPTLPSRQWPHVVATCYPVLEVAGSSVELREEDLIRVATYLQVSYTDAASCFHLAYCSSAYHVARKLNGFCRRAGWALTQGSALPVSQQHEVIELYRWVLLNK